MGPLLVAQELEAVTQLESDLIPVVCEMERNAAHVNKDKLKEFVHDSAAMLEDLLFEVSRECGFQVNPDKNADLVKLFDFLKLAYPGRTEPSTRFPNGQPSFADALLGKVDHPLVQMVRRSGKLASLRSKFLVPYSQVVGDDGLLRFALHQLRGDEYGTVRGRFSMSGSSKGIGQFGANLQQVFRVNSQRMAFGFAHDDSSHDHEIFLVRSLFEAPVGSTYLSADAQSIEYRLAAHYAIAPALIEAYQADIRQLQEGRLTDKWVDFHRVVGDVIRPHKDLSRNIIKNANFCLVYGGGKPTLGATLGLGRTESDQIYAIWHRMFPELSKLPKQTEELARKRGYVKTVMGRRARFGTAEQLMWAHAAINYAIQGSAADIMKLKLVELHKVRKWTGLLMRMTVHDEVGGDARQPETAARVREVLNRQSFKLRVPIVWEVETGPNWAVAH
jgi:DNA polymerase-1